MTEPKPNQDLHEQVINTGLRTLVVENQMSVEEAIEAKAIIVDFQTVAVRGFANYLVSELEQAGKKPERFLINRTLDKYLQEE